jgi:NTP pyrophosphatase (non-canonical NTP hydrolase)
MELNTYQVLAQGTNLQTNLESSLELCRLVLGLNEEAGEVAGVVKKKLRGDNLPDEEYKARVKSELGDTLWYLAMVAKQLGFHLEDIAQSNLNKLAERKQNKALHGSGESTNNRG